MLLASIISTVRLMPAGTVTMRLITGRPGWPMDPCTTEPGISRVCQVWLAPCTSFSSGAGIWNSNSRELGSELNICQFGPSGPAWSAAWVKLQSNISNMASRNLAVLTDFPFVIFSSISASRVITITDFITDLLFYTIFSSLWMQIF